MGMGKDKYSFDKIKPVNKLKYSILSGVFMNTCDISNRYRGIEVVDMFFHQIAGRYECDKEAKRLFEVLESDEERNQAVSDILMGVQICSRKALEMKCPCARSK